MIVGARRMLAIGVLAAGVGACRDDAPPPEGEIGDEAGLMRCEGLEAISKESLAAHLQALAEIADRNGGTRSAGTPGYDASADYVEGVLAAAGYAVTRQTFDIKIFTLLDDPVLEQTEPAPASLSDQVRVAEFSGAGDVTAPITAVDVALGLENETTSGCEAEDFDGFPPGNIAVIQRGECTFGDKTIAAQEAGAAAVIIFNRGSTEDNQGTFNGTLTVDTAAAIPVVFTTYAVGTDLIDTEATVRLAVDALTEDKVTVNLLADTPNGDDEVVMYGGHLDSVPAGPGINDNGSGSAALLEAALGVVDCDLAHGVRFAWWGAEEIGLVGSNHYVETLAPEEREFIRFYLNFDMVASPNYVRFVYDGDGSAFDTVGPGISGELEAVFADFFDGAGLPTGEVGFSGRSDYAAFVDAGIPAGGMFTGAEGTKSQKQAESFGGTPDEAYDACYHRACDGVENVDLDVLREITGAVGHTIELYAL